MLHRLPRRARLAIFAVKLAVLGTIVAIGLLGPAQTTSAGLQPGHTGPRGYAVPAVDDDHADRTARVLEAHSCSMAGFGTEHQPLSAVIRSASGALRFVDFDTGWRVYTERGRASLVAVCLDPPPAS
jgi:hypothetical protein